MKNVSRTETIDSWEFDREGRVAGWRRIDGKFDDLVCENCANESNAGNPVTMNEAGHNVYCSVCGMRIS